MVREHTLRDYAEDSPEVRNQRILRQLENPPEDFNARQSLLDRVPAYFLKHNDDLFIPLRRYIRDVLEREIPARNLIGAAHVLKEYRVVPILIATIWVFGGERRGRSQRTVLRVLAWDYERGLAQRKAS